MELRISELTTQEISLTLGAWQLRGRRAGGAQEIALLTAGGLALSIRGLVLEDVELRNAALTIEVERLQADVQIQGSEGDGGATVCLSGARLTELRYRDGTRVASVARLELAGDLTIGGGVVRTGALRLSEVQVELAAPGQAGDAAGSVGQQVALTALASAGLTFAAGTLDLDETRAEGLRFELGELAGTVSLATARGSVRFGAEVAVELSTLDLSTVVARIAGRSLSVATLSTPLLALSPGRPELCVAQGPLSATELSFEDARVCASAARIELSGGFSYGAAGLDVPGLAATELSIAFTPRSAQESEPGDAGPASTDDAPGPNDRRRAAAERRRRFALLDGLAGQVDVDVYVETTYPVYGERTATHHFRVPIAKGALDYEKLERSLSTLEDAVLDIELEADALILEKDLPLVPFDNQTLIRWPLDAEEHALAQAQRVRLSTLAGYELAERQPRDAAVATKSDPQKAPVELHRLDLRDLDATLDLAGGGCLDLGPAGRVRCGKTETPALGKLSVVGTLRYDSKVSLEPGELRLGLASADCDLEALELGARVLDVRGLALRDVDPARSRAIFAGFALQSLELALGSVSAERLRLGTPV